MFKEDFSDLYYIQNRDIALDWLETLWLGIGRLDNEASVDTIGVLESNNFDKVHWNVVYLYLVISVVSVFN